MDGAGLEVKRLGVTMSLSKNVKIERVNTFLHYVAAGMRSYDAARAAGYSDPKQDLARSLHSTELGGKVSLAMLHRMKTVLGPDAMHLTEQWLHDPKTPIKIRWDIAKTLLASTLGTAPTRASLEAAPADIAAMTGAEIVALRRSLEGEMAARAESARLIEGEAVTVVAPAPAQPAPDYLFSTDDESIFD